MAEYTPVPVARLDSEVLLALLEEFASRDGTDYGERDLTLEETTARLRRQLEAGDIAIVVHHPSEQWDLVPRERLDQILDE